MASGPKPPKLKVFRTPIGFHDAYVAAPSQKAALQAWGSESDLFAQKSAELVTDPALAAEPLANPGVVIKRLRGTAAEQIAALAPNVVKPQKKPPSSETEAPPEPRPKPLPKPKPKPKPRPDRSALATAEQALSEAKARQSVELKQLRDREAALERERRDVEHAQHREIDALEEDRIRAEAAYEKAMKRWRA